MKFIGIFSLVFILFQASFAMGSPVLSIDENISEDDFNSDLYTNPDSTEAHEMVITYCEDGEHSQVQLNNTLKPRPTVSPDGNCSIYIKVLSTSSDMGIEDYVLNNTAKPREIRIKDISTMGYYAVAFSPDSKMYAAPRIVHLGDGRNAQYAIDIMSADSNKMIHRELLPFYKENTKSTPMDWDRSEMYGVYWSKDGSSIVYEVLGADMGGGLYPTTLVTNRLNVNYTELRKMNGYEDPVKENAEFSGYDELMQSYKANQTESDEQVMNSPQSEQAEQNTSEDDEQPLSLPGFGVVAAIVTLFMSWKWKRGSR
jgi:hypothetical protein